MLTFLQQNPEKPSHLWFRLSPQGATHKKGKSLKIIMEKHEQNWVYPYILLKGVKWSFAVFQNVTLILIKKKN